MPEPPQQPEQRPGAGEPIAAAQTAQNRDEAAHVASSPAAQGTSAQPQAALEGQHEAMQGAYDSGAVQRPASGGSVSQAPHDAMQDAYSRMAEQRGASVHSLSSPTGVATSAPAQPSAAAEAGGLDVAAQATPKAGTTLSESSSTVMDKAEVGSEGASAVADGVCRFMR